MRELSATTFASRTFGPAPEFNVVIVYEELESGKRARRTYDYLAEQLGHESEFKHAMWKFDILAIPHLRDMAVKDVMNADIVVVSMARAREVPAAVKDWIESWLGFAAKPMALVALFDSESTDTRISRNYLEAVANRGGMKFFANPDLPAGERKVPEAPHSVLRNNQHSPGARHEVSSPRWGINE
jgi:hypothetical protein